MHIQLIPVLGQSGGEQIDEDSQFLKNNTKCFFPRLISEKRFEPSEYFEPQKMKQNKSDYPQPSSKLLVWLNDIKTLLESIKENIDNPANKRKCSKLRKKQFSEIKSRTDNQTDNIHKRKKNHLKDYSAEVCKGWKNLGDVKEEDDTTKSKNISQKVVGFSGSAKFFKSISSLSSRDVLPVETSPDDIVNRSHSTENVSTVPSSSNKSSSVFPKVEDCNKNKTDISKCYKTSSLNESVIKRKQMKCPFCLKKFVDLNVLENHQITHIKTPMIASCLKKARIVLKRINLADYMQEKSISDSRMLSIVEEVYKTLKCNICTRKFTNRLELKLHLSSAHSFRSMYTNLRQRSGAISFMCKVCSSEYTNKIELKKHVMSHVSSDPYPCHECGAKFNQSRNFLKHFKGHFPFITEPVSMKSILMQSIRSVKCLPLFKESVSTTVELSKEQGTMGKIPHEHQRSLDQVAGQKKSFFSKTSATNGAAIECNTYTTQLSKVHKNVDEIISQKYTSMDDIGNQKSEETVETLAGESAETDDIGNVKSEESVETSTWESEEISNSMQLEQQPESAWGSAEIINSLEYEQQPVPTTYIENTSEMMGKFEMPNKEYVCRFCKKVYNGRLSLTKHLKQKHSLNFICSYCSTPFNNSQNLQNHVKVRHGYNKANICEVCGFVAQTNWKCKQHMFSHTSSNRFLCNICGVKLKYNSSLKRHMKSHHQTVPVQLNNLVEESTVGDQITTVGQFPKNLHINEQSVLVNSDVVDTVDHNLEGIQNAYFMAEVANMDPDVQEYGNVDLAYQDQDYVDQLAYHDQTYVDPEFHNQDQMIDQTPNVHHMNYQDHKNVDQIICQDNTEVVNITNIDRTHQFPEPKRNKLINKLKSVSLNKKKSHNTPMINLAQGEDYLTCKVCGAVLSSKYHLFTHMENVHTPAKQIIMCTICNISVKYKGNLKRHMKSHYPNMSSVELRNLAKTHAVSMPAADISIIETTVHLSEDQTQVDQEDMYQIDDTDHIPYQEHISKDQISNQNKFVEMFGPVDIVDGSLSCKICAKKFTTRFGLNLHLRKDHSLGLICSLCSIHCKDLKELHEHTQLIHKIDGSVNICSTCGCIFNSKSGLNRHMESHLPSKLLPCKICGVKLKNHGSLRSHIKKHLPAGYDRQQLLMLVQESKSAAEGILPIEVDVTQNQVTTVSQRGFSESQPGSSRSSQNNDENNWEQNPAENPMIIDSGGILHQILAHEHNESNVVPSLGGLAQDNWSYGVDNCVDMEQDDDCIIIDDDDRETNVNNCHNNEEDDIIIENEFIALNPASFMGFGIQVQGGESVNKNQHLVQN